MKRTVKILCVILALLLIAAGVFVWWQWDNLKALYMAKTEDAETILKQAEERAREHQKELEQYDVILKVPTQEEKDELLSGGSIKTEEQGKPGGEKETLTDTSKEDAPEKTQPTDQPTEQSILDRCIQELYDCETNLMARLGTMKQEATAEWNALPKSQRTKAKKEEIGYRGLGECYDMEVEIDAKVQGILAKYRAELESINGDTAPLETLWEYYCEEKTSTKAYYLNKYL